MSAVILLLWMLALPVLGAPADTPDPRLIQLEAELIEAQTERDLGNLLPARYDEFVRGFRSKLDSTWSEVEKSASNAIVHSRIRLRFGEAEAGANKQAVESILVSGRTALDRGDYAEALRTAEAVLKVDPQNATAMGLKRLSAGRGPAYPSASEARSEADQPSGAGSSNPQNGITGIAVVENPAKRVLANMPVPPSPDDPAVYDPAEQASRIPFRTIAAMAFVSAGSLLLFGGIGAPQLEERFPNIRRNLGIAAFVAGSMAAAAGSMPALQTALMARAPLIAATGSATPVVARNVPASSREALAQSAAHAARLKEHLRQFEKYGEAGYRVLSDGRIRYYDIPHRAKTPGMDIWRRVREWDPVSGVKRTWFETIDKAGRQRIIRPETGEEKVHYYFDAAGRYVEKR